MKRKCMIIAALLFFLLFLSGLCEVDATTYPDDPGQYQGHYYSVYTFDDGTYDDAIELCKNLGGHLATLTSQGENDYVYSYIKSKGYKDAYFGLTNKDRKSWEWINAEKLDFTNWAPGEPFGLFEYYGMFYSRFSKGEWNNGSFGFGEEKNFICEWDSDPLRMKFSITYILNGGTNDSLNPSDYYPADSTRINDAKRSGYMFEGWYLDGQKIRAIPRRTVGDITLEAKWERSDDSLGLNPNLPPVQGEAQHLTDYLLPSLVLPLDVGNYEGHIYDVFTIDSGTYNVAIEYCKSLGGHLATLTSQGENDYVYNYIKSKGYKDAYFGYADLDGKGWQWITGEKSDYKNWAPGEPNGLLEDYAMFYHVYPSGKWNDGDFELKLTPGDKKNFICEWDSDPLQMKFNITYFLNGGTLDRIAPNGYYSAKGLKLMNPTRAGYRFKGWYSGDEKITEISKRTIGNFNLEARWVKAETTNLLDLGKPKRFNVTATYRDTATQMNIRYTAPYNDLYFTSYKSTENQTDLARLSMLAAATAYHEKNAQTLLENCGFSQKRFTNNVTETDNDHVSASVGIKRLGRTTIVAILIKGTSGNYEWISNFNLGYENTHQGFYLAEQELWEQVKAWLQEEDVLTKDGKPKGSVKYWITGHSRGGAVANILAKELSDNPYYGKENVYAYTFASPRVSTAAKATENTSNNIFNYLNPGDFVTEVAPEAWGYARYGKDIVFSSSSKAEMTELFNRATGYIYGGYTQEGKMSLVDAFLLYAGNGVEDYYNSLITTEINGEKMPVSPASFCQKGIAYIMASNEINSEKGKAVAGAFAMTNPLAAGVLIKMAVEGKLLDLINHSHTQAGYLCWLDAMY